MILQIEPGEDLDFQLVALEAPARQQLRREFAPGYLRAERAGVVAIEPARHHRLEREAFAVEAAGRPEHAAIGERTAVVGGNFPAKLADTPLEVFL